MEHTWSWRKYCYMKISNTKKFANEIIVWNYSTLHKCSMKNWMFNKFVWTLISQTHGDYWYICLYSKAYPLIIKRFINLVIDHHAVPVGELHGLDILAYEIRNLFLGFWRFSAPKNSHYTILVVQVHVMGQVLMVVLWPRKGYLHSVRYIISPPWPMHEVYSICRLDIHVCIIPHTV